METYYYVDENRQQAGPCDLETLLERGITESTLVWKQGMADWQPARNVPEVADALRAAASRAAAEPPAESPVAPPAGPAAPRPESADSQPEVPGPPAEPAAPQPEAPAEEKAGEGPAKDYLTWSILSTIFCLFGFSFSVAGIVMSALTRSFNARGNYRLAHLFSKLAFWFTIAGTALGFAYWSFVVMAFALSQ